MKPLTSNKKHFGKYIALGGRKVIAYGKNVGKVIEKARKQGYEVPVIVFVPDPKITHIYTAA